MLLIDNRGLFYLTRIIKRVYLFATELVFIKEIIQIHLYVF